MSEHLLKGYYLTRVYFDESNPFSVVTDLPYQKAVDICSKFCSHRGVHGETNNQAAYMEERIKTEDWLRTQAQNADVTLLKPTPVYFTLTHEPQDRRLSDGKKVLSIPAETVDLSHFSFTVGDSMGNRTIEQQCQKNPEFGKKYAHPWQNSVFNAQQIADHLQTNPLEGDYLKGGRYIEVQMWAHAPLPLERPVVSAPKSPKNA